MSRAPAADVRIDLLSATVSHRGPLDPARTDHLLRRLAEVELDRAFAGIDLPSGHWCVRRLDVPVRLAPAGTDTGLVRAWAAELAGAVGRAVRRGYSRAGGTGTGADPDVVGYRSVRDAALDVVASVPLDRWERAWAWRQMDMPPTTVASPGVEAR